MSINEKSDQQQPVKHLTIVGLGSIGRRHLRVARENFAGLKISAVRSGLGGDPAERNLLDAEFMSIEEACRNGVDAAVISSPASLHAAQACSLIENNVNVLIEKPVAISIDDVSTIEQALGTRDLVCQVGYVLRHHPALQYLKKCIEDRMIGEISHIRSVCSSYLPEWRPGTDYRNSVSSKTTLGGGVLFELSHDLDYLLWCFGPVADVKANLASRNILGIEAPETAQLMLRHDSGAIASVHLDFNSRTTIRQCSVTGSAGMLVWDGVDQSVICRTDEGETTRSFAQPADKMYADQLTSFIGLCEGKKKAGVTLGEGSQVLEVINAALSCG